MNQKVFQKRTLKWGLLIETHDQIGKAKIKAPGRCKILLNNRFYNLKKNTSTE